MSVVLLMVLACSTPPPPLLVLAPTSTQVPVERLIRDWAASEGTEATVVFDDSPALSRMVDAGTPADLLLLSDTGRMDRLAEREHLVPGSRALLAGDDLVVLVSVNATHPPRDLAGLLDPERPMFAPPADSAESQHLRSQLEAADSWPAAEDRITHVHDEAAVIARVVDDPEAVGFLSSGRANLGANVEIAFPFPSRTPALLIEGAVVAHAERADTASELLRFLCSEGAEAPFRARGFRGLGSSHAPPSPHPAGAAPPRATLAPAPDRTRSHPPDRAARQPPGDEGRLPPRPPGSPPPETPLPPPRPHGAAK